METDRLRNTIWDYLYQARDSKSLDEIAAFAGHEPQAISAAVDHEWFQTAHDKVTIAYAQAVHRAPEPLLPMSDHGMGRPEANSPQRS